MSLDQLKGQVIAFGKVKNGVPFWQAYQDMAWTVGKFEHQLFIQYV